MEGGKRSVASITLPTGGFNAISMKYRWHVTYYGRTPEETTMAFSLNMIQIMVNSLDVLINGSTDRMLLHFPLAAPGEDIDAGKRRKENPCLFRCKSDNIHYRRPFYGIDQLLIYNQRWIRRNESG
jgi:hypothetical protein